MTRMLTVDIGNTRSKVAVFEDNVLTDFCSFYQISELEAYLQDAALPVMACSVSHKPEFEGLQVKWLKADMNLPFQIDVAKPSQIGPDRLAAVLGALRLFPKKEILIIDAGTCITYEYVSAKGVYWGGAISPGLRLRYQSMHDHTAALPLLGVAKEFPMREGRDTDSAMHSGVMFGFRAEIAERISDFQRKNEDSVVLITGGDAQFLAKPLKTGIFVEPMLLHLGLNYVYQSL